MKCEKFFSALESDEVGANVLSELSELLIRMCDLVSDITAIDEVIEVSKYVLRYNCRLPYTKYDINLIRSVEDQALTWLIDISDKLDPIVVYDNYIEALDRIESMLRSDDEYSEQ